MERAERVIRAWDDAGSNNGATLVYERDGADWRFVCKLLPDAVGEFLTMGNGVAVMEEDVLSSADGGRLFVHEVPPYLSVHCICDALAPCANPDASRGCVNSSGRGGSLAACHSASVTADDLTLDATFLPAGQSGLVFMGPSTIAPIPFGDGLRCVDGGGVGLFRFPVHASDPEGSFTEGPGIVAHSHASFPPAGGIEAGDTWSFQAWYRDPAGPCGSGFNTSQALAIQFEP